MIKFRKGVGLGIDRTKLPQTEAAHHGALTNFLNARGVAHETTKISPENLKPTQSDFDPKKVEELKKIKNLGHSIVVSKDGHIVDGHHRAIAAAEKGEDVKAIVLDADVKKALDLVKRFPSARMKREEGGEVESLPMRLPYGQRYNPKTDKLDAPESKGVGFKGPLKQDDHIVSEYSSDRDVQYPSIYEGISPKDLSAVMMAERIHRPAPRDVDDRAYAAAKRRTAEGRSPFFEQGRDKYPEWSPDQDWPRPAVMRDEGGPVMDDEVKDALRVATQYDTGPQEGEATMRSYEPSWRERFEEFVKGTDTARPSPERRRFAEGLTDIVSGAPGVSNALSGERLRNAMESDDVYGAGAAALGMLPGVGGYLSRRVLNNPVVRDALRLTRDRGGKAKAKAPPAVGSDAYWAERDAIYALPHEQRGGPKDPLRYVSPEEYRKGNLGRKEFALDRGGRAGMDLGGDPTAINPTANPTTSNPVVSANQPVQDPARNYVQSLYQNILGRPGEQSGVDYWTNQLNEGYVDQPTALQQFAQSQEFGNLYQQDPTKAVSSLYQTALGRSPEQEGLDYWTQQAKSGMNLGDMVSSFEGSQEGQDVQGINQAYQDFTGNVANQDQLTQAKNLLGSEGDWSGFLEKTFPQQMQQYGNQYAGDFLSDATGAVGDAFNVAGDAVSGAVNSTADVVEAAKKRFMRAMDEMGISDPITRLAMAASVQGETGFNPVPEKSYATTSNKRIRQVLPQARRYSDAQLNELKKDPRTFFNEMYKHSAGNQGGDDGYNYRGRGDVQLTGRYNYRYYGQKAGLGNKLEENPDLMNDPDIASRVSVAYMKDRMQKARGKTVFDKVARGINKSAPSIAAKRAAYNKWSKDNPFANFDASVQAAYDQQQEAETSKLDPEISGVADNSGVGGTSIDSSIQGINDLGSFTAPYTPQEIRDQMGSNQAISDSVVSPGGVVYNQPHTTHTTHTSPATHVSPVTHTGGGGSHVTNHGSGSVSFGPAEPSGVAGTGIDYGISSSVHHTSAADPYFGHGHNMHFNPQTGQWMDAAMARNLDPAYDMARGGIVRASGGVIKSDDEDVENALRLAKRKGGRINTRIDKDPDFDMSMRLARGGKSPAYARKEGQNPEGGLNAKGRAAARAEGHNLKPPAPHPKNEKDAARRKSFCARMEGMKRENTSAETARDPDSRINKSLRAWNCADGGEVWDKPRPKGLGEVKHLSSSQKKSAKASAKAAGRRYPNLVDNLNASKK